MGLNLSTGGHQFVSAHRGHPVVAWEYEENGEAAGTSHIGPMAEEFHDAFDVGSSDEHSNAINADGVALAAIQGLSAELDERDARIDDLETTVEQQREELAERDERIDDLEERLAALEAHLDTDAVADD